MFPILEEYIESKYIRNRKTTIKNAIIDIISKR